VIPPLGNSDFVAHMESVLDVYKTPYDKRYPVVCMDESPKQLIKQTRIPIARKPGQDAKEGTMSTQGRVCQISLWPMNL